MQFVVRILKYVRLPMLLIFIFAVARFSLGVGGVPYAPRGNAMFSVFVLTLASCFYWGAMSKKVGGLGWGGTAMLGWTLGFYAQILIFCATLLSYLLNVQDVSYFTNWDSLNVPEGTVVPMAKAMQARVLGLVFGPVLPIVAALIGRALSWFAPTPPSE